MSPSPPTRPRWARACLGWLGRLGLRGKWLEKLYRASLPRPYKHLTDCGPRFHLSGDSPDLDRDIVRDGEVIGETQSLASIEGRFRDGACFILGTGPSINALDLTLLEGRALMGVNGAISVMKPNGLAPTHYAVTDRDFFENRFEMIRDVVASGSDCFFSPGGLRVMAERDPTLLASPKLYLSTVVNRPYGRPRRSQESFLRWAAGEPGLVLPHPPRDDDCRVGWSRDLRHGVFCSRTILFRALQIADFLGYRRLYVLGMDLHYKGPGGRAYGEGAKARPTKIERDFEPFILPSFEVLKGEIDSGALEVYNLSHESRLSRDVLPRKTLEEALEIESTLASH